MPSKNALRFGIGLMALVLATAGCGNSKDNDKSSSGSGGKASTSASASDSASSSGSSGTAGAAGTATAAATLRANLTQLLREHVDLTGFLVQTAVGTGLTSPQTAAATTVLDQNTQALGKAIGTAYGSSAQQTFLKTWRAHIGFFVTYTKGVAMNSASMKAQAQTQLNGYIASFSTFVSGATKLPASAVAADLKGHVQTLETAIDSIVGKKADAASKLQEAAMHMDGTAAVLAKGIASSKTLAGSPDAPSSALRASLTGLLVQHVAQTGTLVQTAVQSGLTAPQTAAATTALDQNTQDLGKAIGSVYGAAAQRSFLQMWRAHIGFFVTYTKGVAMNSASMKAQAQTQLNGYIASFSKFVNGATKLPAAAVSADLKGHVQTLEAAIDSIVGKKADAASKLSMAEDHMAGTAAVLAKGIVASTPSKFTS